MWHVEGGASKNYVTGREGVSGFVKIHIILCSIKISIPSGTCLLIPLKSIENLVYSGQVQVTCIF